jgi:hypothetical protein
MVGNRWSSEQINALYKLWQSNLPRDIISQQIGKSAKAIRIKASQLDIKRPNRIWTEEGLKRRKESTSRTFKGKKQGSNRKKVIQTEEAKRNARNAIRNNPNELKRRGNFIRNYNLTKKDYSTPWNKGMHPWEWMNITEPEFLDMIFKSRDIRPTSIERRLITVIKDYKLPYRYVGDGEIWIARKCPDFINTNSGKKLIEAQGDYWHTKEESKEREEHFAKYGFKTLFIWESEMKVMSDFDIS